MDGMNFLFWYHNRSKNDTLDISYLPVYVWLLKRYINELNFVTSTNEDIFITVTCQKKKQSFMNYIFLKLPMKTYEVFKEIILQLRCPGSQDIWN